MYLGYIGYKNQIVQAIESELGHAINLPGSTVNYLLPWKIFWLNQSQYLNPQKLCNTGIFPEAE